MDLERQQTCINGSEESCTKWKVVERKVVEVIVTMITVSVPLVPILNFVLSSKWTNWQKVLSFFGALIKRPEAKFAEGDELVL